ncbi:MAG: hypothetical protein RSC62_09565 [Cetobacterium sp.]|uniref:hypothetical protein n=1 Tax=Cetobacterium sp. TaxID=2071632 RepID=UPI002FC9E50A
MIFGKGLLNAIKAEKEAKFPIITLEEELINQIEKIRDLYCEVEFSEKLKIYIIKYENKLFINYLNDYIVYKETLENHKRILENHLGIYSGNSDTDIRKKYVWLAKYHNYFVEKYGYTDKLCPENQRRIYNDKLLLINIID